MMGTNRFLKWVPLFCGMVCALESAPAAAIPVFARIYDKPCGTCHTVFPQLNPDGENFRAHGFHGLSPAVKPLRVGPLLDVPGTLPFAFYLAAGEDVTKSGSPGTPSPRHTHFNLPFLSLLAGGELGSHLAFLMDYELLETEPDTGKITVNSLPEQAYLLAHAEQLGWLGNLRVGWFELPLGVSPRVHRLAAQPYLTYGLSGCSLLGRAPPGVDCTDVPVLAESQIGAELSVQRPSSGLGWAIGLTNGNNNRLDDKASRDFYLRVSQQVGFQKAGLFLLYNPDVLGVRGTSDRTLRLGPDLTWYTRRLRMLAQFLANFESSPTGRAEELWYYGTFLEGEYRLTPTVLMLARVEYAWTRQFDDTSEGGETRVRRQVWTVTGGAQWLVLENLKLVAEVTYEEDHEALSNITGGSWSGTVRVTTATWALAPPGVRHWPHRERTP